MATNITIGLLPLEALLALLTKILELISNQQQLVLTAPPEYREQYFKRLSKIEDFWYRPAELIGDAITKIIEVALKEEPPK